MLITSGHVAQASRSRKLLQYLSESKRGALFASVPPIVHVLGTKSLSKIRHETSADTGPRVPTTEEGVLGTIVDVECFKARLRCCAGYRVSAITDEC